MLWGMCGDVCGWEVGEEVGGKERLQAEGREYAKAQGHKSSWCV